MTRRRSLAGTLLGLQGALVETALESLSTEQREKLDATKTQRIMEAAITCAGNIGRILENQQPETADIGPTRNG
jgi:hypothetical protein